MDIDLLNEPLIWTTKGNMKVADLEHYIQWEDTEDYTKLTEFFVMKESKELVKSSTHVRSKKGNVLAGEIPTV